MGGTMQELTKGGPMEKLMVIGSREEWTADPGDGHEGGDPWQQ